MIANTLPFRDRYHRWLAIALIASVIAQSAYAADGDLDSTFGATGSGYTIIDFGNGSNGHQDGAHRLLRQPDGKFVAVGSVDSAYVLGPGSFRTFLTNSSGCFSCHSRRLSSGVL